MRRLLKKTLVAWLILPLLLTFGACLIHAQSLATPIPPQPGGDVKPITLSVAVRSDGTWEGEARFSPLALSEPGAWDAQREAAAIFGEYGIRYSLSEKKDGGYTFSLAGDDAREIVELALSAGHTVKRLDGPVALDVGGFVRASQKMTLTLTSNPSTGYSWEMDPQAGGALSQVNGVEMYQTALGLGVPARQVILLKAGETGPADLHLLYRRPWQAEIPPTIVISIRSEGLSLAETCAALSAPLPSSPPSDIFGIQRDEMLGQPQQPASLSSTQALPSAYDWCATHGGCTSVKNQGECGSCWAFATVGPMEGLLQAAGQTTDLSEQYLVSCNTEDWGCGGGWFAHDYHWNTRPPGESQAGAVLESAFPYVASDAPCAGPYTHPHKIISWHYVDGYSVPSVDAIKQAIYDHGPVAAAICVGDAFRSYPGGVFQIEESSQCGSNDVNHAIVLVGWNDAEQTWTLRNSWGTGWGESGYMRIRYSTSNVGYAANYVVYNAPFVATDWAYLPIVTRGFEANPSLDNGNFENGQDGSWAESSSNGWNLIMNASDLSVSPHGGSWAAWLGGDDDETAILSQQVIVPSDVTTLNYWYVIGSDDSCGYDYAYVSLESSVLKTYNLCASNNTGGWVSQQVDVTSWRGQAVELRFVAETDWVLNSNFFLDDVSFSTVTAPAALSIFPADSVPHAAAPR